MAKIGIKQIDLEQAVRFGVAPSPDLQNLGIVGKSEIAEATMILVELALGKPRVAYSYLENTNYEIPIYIDETTPLAIRFERTALSNYHQPTIVISSGNTLPLIPSQYRQ